MALIPGVGEEWGPLSCRGRKGADTGGTHTRVQVGMGCCRILRCSRGLDVPTFMIERTIVWKQIQHQAVPASSARMQGRIYGHDADADMSTHDHQTTQRSLTTDDTQAFPP